MTGMDPLGRAAGRQLANLYRFSQRARGKVFSLAVSGSFDRFGAHSVIEPPVRLLGERHIRVGDRVFIGSGSWLQVIDDGGSIVIGDGTSISGSCVLSSTLSIRLGERVLFARNVYVADHMHAFSNLDVAVQDQGIERRGAVEIGRGAWLGQNVVVGPGVTIGAGAVIGANSVVLDDVPAFAVAVGAPARVVRMLTPTPEADKRTG